MNPLLAAFGLASLFTLGQLDAADFDRCVARGRDALAAGHFDEASIAFQEALKARPEDARGWSLLARSQCGAAETELARGEEGQAQANLLIAKAEESARKAIECDERSPEGFATLGHVLGRLGKLEEAIATLYHAQKLSPPTPDLLIDLADALLLSRQDALAADDAAGAASRAAEAQRALEQAAALLDLGAEVQRRLGELDALQGRPVDALKAYRHAISLKPADASLHEAHLQLVEQSQKFDDSIAFYTGLVDEPGFALWYRSRCRELAGHFAFNKEKDFKKAAELYTRSCEDLIGSARANPEFKPNVTGYLPTLRSFRGYALTKGEDFSGAEAAFLAALDLKPDHEHALNGLHELQDAMWKKWGEESMPKEKMDEIRGFAAKVCLVEPGRAENWNNYGLFARDAAKYEESYLAYRHALALEPKNARYLNDTALILMYHLDRDLDRAQQWLEEAITFAEQGGNDNDRLTESRVADQETLGDAYANLINLMQSRGQLDYAKRLLLDFAAKLPKRSEVNFWRKKLMPETVVEPAPATVEDPAKVGDEAKDEAKDEDDTKVEDGAEDDGKDDGANEEKDEGTDDGKGESATDGATEGDGGEG